MDPKPAMAATQIRPAIRSRGLILATMAITTAVVGIRYQAASMKTNELNQRSRAPYYVSVDRSGGGV
ncbi:uncharacterized protein CTRU02_212096 [Colletotrichum truncatum]|uniref:Uncharacterized protein n=1 Tax=Colletotrichum truncatum TaxID=5467 RepID=A0ACC3YML0_COLTU|nr:uncharacterized protein CTRU02_06833 [Colletotrichum truncatum]KAF6792216.1 hypothetical protein CTRU02_06833 [Colletotrichum truncatum]